MKTFFVTLTIFAVSAVAIEQILTEYEDKLKNEAWKLGASSYQFLPQDVGAAVSRASSLPHAEYEAKLRNEAWKLGASSKTFI